MHLKRMPCNEHPYSVIFSTAMIFPRHRLLKHPSPQISISSNIPSPRPHLHSPFPFPLTKPVPLPTSIRHRSLILALFHIPLAIRIRLVPRQCWVSGCLLGGCKGGIVVGAAGV